MDIINEAYETNATRLGPSSDVDQLAPRQVLIHIKKARNLFRSKSPYLLWKFGHQESIFDPLEMSMTEDAPSSNASYGPCATSNRSPEDNGVSLGQPAIYGSSVPIPIKNSRHKGSLRDFTWNATVLADVSANRTFGDIYIFDREGGFRGYVRINLQTDNNRNRRVRLSPQPGRALDHISGELLIRIRPVESQTFSKEIDLDFSDFSRSQIIAQGEMLGSIYRVQGKNSGKLYAVKVIEGSENLARVMLRSERVNSPFIVSPIFAIHSEVSASLYVFLDYVCGGTLQSNMEAGLPSFSRAIHYTAELILALEDIGKCSVESFRLHPRKVLLDSLGFVVLVDFGLSYLGVDPTTDISYSAPEELNSSVKTSASNFWTLGVMLFEMTFGFHPFYDTSRTQTIENILHGELPFPEVELDSPVDPTRMQIVDLCKKLLLRNPARRNGIAPLNGAVNYIKNHALFVDIDWEAIRRRNYQPLYRPSVIFRSEAAVVADHKQNDADIDELLDELDHHLAFSDDEEQQEPAQQLKIPFIEGSPASSGTPFPIGSPVVVSSKDSTSVYATPVSRLGSFNSTLSPTSNEGSSKYVTPSSQHPYRSRESGSRKSGLLNQVLQSKNVAVQPTSTFGRLLQERGLVLPPKEQLDWSGRGQHAEYQIIEDIPLKPLAAIGYGGSALVDSVLCRRIKLARKTMICSRRQRLDVLINEVEHLQRLRHPHIVQLVGSYLQGKKFAILLYPATEGNLATFYEMCGPENTAEEQTLVSVDTSSPMTCLKPEAFLLEPESIVHLRCTMEKIEAVLLISFRSGAYSWK
ncbi:hypothetical protein IFR05_006705 [Cadophora sp. M221]|nr:hypothetical protein IFR05_006705 [Cadophora sp. M221]